MVFEPRTSNVESRATRREREELDAAGREHDYLFEAGNRVRFDDRSGIVAACFPDGICHVRVDGTNRMVATHASMLTLDRTLPNRTIKTPGVWSA
jgi:hypothetical protein